MVRINFTIFTI